MTMIRPKPLIDTLYGPLRLAVDWTLDRSPRKQPDLCIAAWLAAFGSIMRGYRTQSDMRSNLFAVGVAPSGSGKDAPRGAIRRAFIEAGLADHIGGENIASDAGLLAAVQRSPGILFLMDEFGHTLRGMTDAAKAPAHIAKIAQTLTTLYTSSSEAFLGTEYADQKARPRITIAEPCVCIYGTTTPEQFYGIMTASRVDDGTLARYLCVDAGDAIPFDDSGASKLGSPPPAELVEALRAIVARRDGASGLPQSSVVVPAAVVLPYERDAGNLIDSARGYADDRIRDSDPAERPLWARLAAMTDKLALILTIAQNPGAGEIDYDDVRIGYRLARRSIKTLAKGRQRFAAESETERRTKRVEEIIRQGGRNGIRRSSLTDKTKWLQRREREEILATLIESGRVVADTRASLTKPAQVFVHADFAAGGDVILFPNTAHRPAGGSLVSKSGAGGGKVPPCPPNAPAGF